MDTPTPIPPAPSNSLHELLLQLAIAGLGKIEHSHLLPGVVDAVKPYLGEVVKELIPEKHIPHELHILGRLGLAVVQRATMDKVIAQQQIESNSSNSNSNSSTGTSQPRVQVSDIGRGRR